ncbi:cholesterol oxidase [Rhodococcus sp. 06-462-5]|uniref:GMC oxidoreductase n=1 Tax=unclassified Rhodococcus (in: high G+C Gram-positive bacteria) TaxID=192944 RepID=UPI000B9AB052|nr:MULTISPECIES: GMC oxidoreductase [unclassified Rhodococcus (in: high G+C Gram-positive bacteria)]OZC76602.1 cholesterol oxidase [Rhodococcus sp. 06-462-5]OZE64659.1 cholesterol oxidase [Rhodococcus sp. 02-925g]
MNRRQLLRLAAAGMLGAAAAPVLGSAGAPGSATAGALPIGAERIRSLVPELFADPPRPPDHSPVLVIGSGFGASAAALRMAQAGTQVTVLERGLRWPRDPWREIFTADMTADGRGLWQQTSFTNITGMPVGPVDLFGGVLDTTRYENLSVWRGAAVGGGSIVYTGVTIAPDKKFFDASFGGRLNYDEMAATWYPKARSMLRPSPMPEDVYNSPNFAHSRTWDDHARRAGFTPQAVDGNWNWNVVRDEIGGRSRPSATVGASTFGNSNGAKHDLTQNYIPQAEATGRATVCHSHRVAAIGAESGGRYRVEIERLDPFGNIVETRTLTCDTLVLGAGSIGTTELLMRARTTGALTNLNEFVGTGWGTNGDASMTRSLGPMSAGPQGAPCASRIVDDSGLPLTVENWYVPGVPMNLGFIGSLGMTIDPLRGNFGFDSATDRLTLNWPKGGSRDTVEALRAVQNRMAQAGGTIVAAEPFTRDVDDTFTAHPLGGAVLGDVTDGYGRVKGHPGLYVVDGALIPGSTGAANPSLTITALAERNVAQIIADGR